MEVQVLGPCRVVDGATAHGETIVLSRIQRRILSGLALSAPGVVSLGDLFEVVWGAQHPTTAHAALRNQISRLRQRLGPLAIQTEPDGYRLLLPTDAQRAESSMRDAEQAWQQGDAGATFALTDEALQLWRGAIGADLDHLRTLGSLRRIDEMQRSFEDLRLAAAIELGRLRWAVVEAERMVEATPFDEQRWVLLIETLDAAGRRGDALGAFGRARRTLADHLGIEPGTALRAAEAAILHPPGAPVGRTGVGLVGRDESIGHVMEMLDQHGAALLIGEEGVGKSTLLASIAGRYRRAGTRVATTAGAATIDTPVRILTSLLEALGLELDRSLPPVHSFARALAAARRAGPVVLAVDDVDLAGLTSMAALDAAVTVAGVTVVATATEPELVTAPSLRAATVVVHPLDDDATVQLARALLADHLDTASSHVGWLAELSAGNALLLESLLADPEVRAILTADASGGGPRPDLPAASGLRDLVERRLQRLAAATRGALAVAAVCAPDCSEALLRELAPTSSVDAAVAAGLVERVVGPGDVALVRYRHDAVRRIVYDGIPPGPRLELHDRAASHLAARGATPEAVATHALAAADLDPLTACHRALDAAASASRDGAHADAARWCAQAAHVAGLAGDLGEHLRVEASVRRADALRLAGDPDQEQALFDAAEAAFGLGDPRLIGDAVFALLQLGATTVSGALHHAATELVSRALLVVHDVEQRAVISAAASLTHSMTGDADLCRTLFAQAERDASSADARRRVLPFAYLALGHPRDLDERERLTAELLALGAADDDPVALFEAEHLAFSVAIQRGDGDRVRAAVQRSTALADRVGDVGRRWSLTYERAAVAHLDDELATAERLADEGFALFAGVSPTRAFAVYGSQLLAIRLAQGRITELIEPLTQLLAEQPTVPAWNAALALATAATDRDVAAHHAAVALEGVDDDFVWLAAHVIGGMAAATVGDAATVASYRERLLPWSGLACWQGACCYGPVDLPLALLARTAGDADAAAHHAAQARLLARSLAAPVFLRQIDAHFPTT